MPTRSWCFVHPALAAWSATIMPTMAGFTVLNGWVETGLNASHMAGPHHVLFEGNYSFNADSDDTHGNAIYLTFFRNWLSGQRRSFNDANPTYGRPCLWFVVGFICRKCAGSPRSSWLAGITPIQL